MITNKERENISKMNKTYIYEYIVCSYPSLMRPVGWCRMHLSLLEHPGPATGFGSRMHTTTLTDRQAIVQRDCVCEVTVRKCKAKLVSKHFGRRHELRSRPAKRSMTFQWHGTAGVGS